MKRDPAECGEGTDAIVLRRISYGETDLVLQLATRRFGRIACFARAAKRSRRRFPAGFPSFARLEIRVGPPGRADALRPILEAQVVRPHLRLPRDLPCYAAAGLLVEVAREALPEEQPEPDAFDALAEALDRLDEGPFGWGELLAAEMRLLAPLGLAPRLGSCLSCGAPAPPRRAACFDVARGGVICRRCGGAERTISGEARERMLAALAPLAGEAAPPAPDAGPGPLHDAQRILVEFLEHQFGRRFRSARLLEQVAGRGGGPPARRGSSCRRLATPRRTAGPRRKGRRPERVGCVRARGR
ncbi:MAG: DNA repair protein RecO [Myxococcales bacterium]|nr:DNA repair protein RecO [Myxococcales bacterium]